MLDKLLRGGIACGSVTEIVGQASLFLTVNLGLYFTISSLSVFSICLRICR